MNVISDIYKWEIKGYKLQKLQDITILEVDDMGSPTFNDEWYLSSFRYDMMEDGNVKVQKLKVYVVSVLLPLGISGMGFELKIKHHKSNEFQVEFVRSKMDEVHCATLELYVKDIIGEEYVTLELQIRITECFDENEVEIFKEEWKKYGIIHSL